MDFPSESEVHHQMSAKDQAKYWLEKDKDRIRKRVFNGKESLEYYCQIQFEGKRRWIRLGTANKSVAAGVAAETYRQLVKGGWEAIEPKSKSPDTQSVGDFMNLVLPTIRSDRSRGDYRRSFYQIIAHIEGIPDDMGHHQKRRDRIEEVPLNRITPERINDWLDCFIDAAGKSEEARKRAESRASSIISDARSLFSNRKNRLGKLGLAQLPNPFASVYAESTVGIKPYRSQFKVHGFTLSDLVLKAKREWGGIDVGEEVQREAYKCLILLAYAGLRKQEADLMPWSHFDPVGHTLKVDDTYWFSPKHHSIGVMQIGPVAAEALQQFRDLSSDSEFILSGGEPRNGLNYSYYRAEQTFEFLNGWIKGYQRQEAFPFANIQKPIHELRKEKGAEIATKQGIYAAKTFLRHKSVSTTEKYYADFLTEINGSLDGVESL